MSALRLWPERRNKKRFGSKRQMNLRELIATAEQLIGPDRDVDGHIYVVVQPDRTKLGGLGWQFLKYGVIRDGIPEYTRSLDAALPNERISLMRLMAGGRYEAEAIDATGQRHKAEAATEPLARRIAALKARAVSS